VRDEPDQLSCQVNDRPARGAALDSDVRIQAQRPGRRQGVAGGDRAADPVAFVRDYLDRDGLAGLDGAGGKHDALDYP
jgi:hypothetical protein